LLFLRALFFLGLLFCFLFAGWDSGVADWAFAEEEFFVDALAEAFGAVFGGDVFGEGCEGAVGGVELHLVLEVVDGVFVADELGSGELGGFVAGLAGQSTDGDLQAEDEEAGAFGVELVGGDAGEDLRDGELDRWAVFEDGEGEGFEGEGGGRGVVDGAAGGEVVEAEVLAAERWAAAALAGDEDVTALEAFLDRLDLGFHHGYFLRNVFSKVFE